MKPPAKARADVIRPAKRVPRQLSRPRKKLVLSKRKAKKTMPKFGGTSKRRCS